MRRLPRLFTVRRKQQCDSVIEGLSGRGGESGFDVKDKLLQLTTMKCSCVFCLCVMVLMSSSVHPSLQVCIHWTQTEFSGRVSLSSDGDKMHRGQF